MGQLKIGRTSQTVFVCARRRHGFTANTMIRRWSSRVECLPKRTNVIHARGCGKHPAVACYAWEDMCGTRSVECMTCKTTLLTWQVAHLIAPDF